MIKAINYIWNNIQKNNAGRKLTKETNQTSLQVRACKLLVGFFILMLILTIISRAVDSITIAQVITQNPQGSMLTFEADGIGKITADAKKYVRIQEGISINKINVKVGQEIKKDDVLITLDNEDINNALTLAENEVKKINNQIEQEQLSFTDTYVSDQEKYKLLYHNAEQDYSNALSDQENAEALYKEKSIEYGQAKADYEKALVVNIDEIYENKCQELKEAKASYSNLSMENENSYKTAADTLEDADNTLQVLLNKDKAIQDYLDRYTGSDPELSKKALTGLLCLAYGDADAYEKHKENAIALQKNLSRAEEDYDDAIRNLRKYGIVNTDYNETEKAMMTFFEMSDELSGYRSAFIQSQRALADARDNLNAENKKETIIKTESKNYLINKADISHPMAGDALLKINQCIYGISGYEKHKEDINKAQKKVSQLKVELDFLQNKNELTLSAEKGKLDKIKEVVDNIKNGTYDKKAAVSSEKQAMDTAEQELQTQLQAVKTAERAVITAKNSISSSKLDYEQSQDRDVKNKENVSKQYAAAKLRVEVIQLTIKDKIQAVTDLKILKNNNGRITAPLSGTIDSITAEAGKKSTADSNISINTGSFGITVTVPKEEGEYVSIGNEIKLTRKGKNEALTTNVEGIRFTTDEQGNETAEITAVMPKGNYISGSVLDARITNNSELYDVCVPLEAVRSDRSGTYCLITHPRNTILGEELLTEKAAVTIIEKDAALAAVSGSLTGEDNVIVSSSKNIAEGDRVRAKQ